MYITPERCKQVTFADPQYQIPDTLLTMKGNPKNLHSYANVAKQPDAKLAIMAGTAELGYARKAGIKDDQILQVPDTTAQLQAVRARRADAAVGTALTMKGLASKGGPQVGWPGSTTIRSIRVMARSPFVRKTRTCAMPSIRNCMRGSAPTII